MRKIMLIVLALMLLAGPTLAQEVDIDPVTGYDRLSVALIGVLFVTLVLTLVFGGVLVIAVRRLADSLPPWALDLIENGPIEIDLEPTLDSIREYFEMTPNPIDDVLWEELEKRLRVLLREALERTPDDTGPAQG